MSHAAHAFGDYVQVAQEKVGPAAKSAIGKSVDFAEKTREAMEPHVAVAREKLQPGVEGARSKVSTLLHDAESHPVLLEAGRRGSAALAAVKGTAPAELSKKDRKRALKEQKKAEKAARKKNKKGGAFSVILKIAAIGAVVGGAVVAVRQFLLSKDDGWTAHEPSRAYTAQEPTHTPDSKLVHSTTTPTDEPTEDIPAAAEAAGTHGEGSYVGAEPPADFVIKGNERSRKYHVPESAGYGRTIADVWFNSEEAAQAAGFTKAQR